MNEIFLLAKLTLICFIVYLLAKRKKKVPNHNDKYSWSEEKPIHTRRSELEKFDDKIVLEIQTAESGVIIVSYFNTTNKFLIRHKEGYGGDYLYQECDSFSECIDALEEIKFRNISSESITKTAWLSRNLLFIDKTIKQELIDRIRSYGGKNLAAIRNLLLTDGSFFYIDNFNRWMEFSSIRFKNKQKK